MSLEFFEEKESYLVYAVRDTTECDECGITPSVIFYATTNELAVNYLKARGYWNYDKQCSEKNYEIEEVEIFKQLPAYNQKELDDKLTGRNLTGEAWPLRARVK